MLPCSPSCAGRSARSERKKSCDFRPRVQGRSGSLQMRRENLHCKIARSVENSDPPAIQYVCTMKLRAFEWDEEDKAGRNYRKHGVRMPEAIPVFDDDPYAITIADQESDSQEERFVSLGMGAIGRILVVVYTYRAG